MLEPAAGADRLLSVGRIVATGADDRPLRRAHEGGELVRLRRGAYSPADHWSTSAADERYDLRIAAVVATRRSDVVLSHHSAARLLGLPLIDWPTAVHITEPQSSRRRSKNGVIVHRRELRTDDVAEVGGFKVTGLLRTLVDLSCEASFRDAVAALDHARREFGSACSIEVLLEALELQGSRQVRRAVRSIEFSTDSSMSPLESLSRVVIAELGFPAPELQKEIRTAAGPRFADFWWEEERILGECDGRAKYRDERYTAGRSADDVVGQEKLRENELSDSRARLVRWTWRDCMKPERLATRLRAAGLRQIRPGRKPEQ